MQSVPSSVDAPIANRLDGIQILRALAILLVLVQHTSLAGYAVRDIGNVVTLPFYVGVELFFVISGFVVTRSLVRSQFSVLKFSVRRIFRLYPALLFFLALSGVQLLAISQSTIPASLKGLFGASPTAFVDQAFGILTGTFINIPTRPIWPNGAMWSLSVEFQFYTVIAVFLMVIALFHMTIKPLLMLFAVASTSLALLICFRLGNYFLPENVHAAGYLLRWKFDFLIAGVVLFLGMEFRLLPWPFAMKVRHIVVALLLVLLVLAIARSPLDVPRYRNDLEGIPMLWTLFGCTFMVWCGSSPLIVNGVPASLRRLLIAIGDRSYTIYLLHYPCMALIWLALYYISYPVIADPAFRYVYGVVQIGALIVLCGGLTEACYRYVEQPAIAAGAQVLKRCQLFWSNAVLRSEGGGVRS